MIERELANVNGGGVARKVGGFWEEVGRTGGGRLVEVKTEVR